MPSQLETAYANFAKMSPEEIKHLDEALTFVTDAQAPTQKGAYNRAMMQTQPIDPQSLKALAAFKSYKFKMQHQPMSQNEKLALKVGKVPDAEIERIGSREKWEQDQLSSFDSLVENTKTMEPETITAEPKKPQRKPKAEPMERMTAIASKPAEEPAPAPLAPTAGPMPGVSLVQPQTRMSIGGAMLPTAPETPPLYTSQPPDEELQRKQMAAAIAAGGVS